MQLLFEAATISFAELHVRLLLKHLEGFARISKRRIRCLSQLSQKPLESLMVHKDLFLYNDRIVVPHTL